jgi:hypothetical protein
MPEFLKELPPWAAGRPTEEQQKLMAKAARFRQLAVEKSLGEAIDAFLNSDDPVERRAALTLMAATDDLKRLAAAMAGAKHTDVWDNGVLALRHWIGRGPGQDQKLYKGLIEIGKLPPAHADTFVQLLHSFSPEELEEPTLYQGLLKQLESERLGIRGLAYWHLTRLAPDGKKFGYDPLAEPAKREEALKRWRALIPPGKLPPKLEPEDN